jgi:hypothetical protein
MAKVLEALIAKGRRVRRPREQKEVAFGIADLSTHEELHERIVKKGGIKSLINLMTKSSDAEAQRFSALAIANCASAVFNRLTIVQDDALQVMSCLSLSFLFGFIGLLIPFNPSTNTHPPLPSNSLLLASNRIHT